MKKLTLLMLIAFLLFSIYLKAQSTIQLLSPLVQTHYLEAFNEPDSNWMMTGYDHSAWKTDTICVVGFGYGDEGYVLTNKEASSLYFRCSFIVNDKKSIENLDLLIDYDDAYIAYINGVEVARVNIDPQIKYPPFDAIATRSHASELIMNTTRQVLGVYLDHSVVDSCIVDGENLLAIHVIPDRQRDDMMLIPYLFDLTNFDFDIYSDLARHKRLIPVDSTNIPLVIIETDKYGIPYNQSIWVTAQMGIVDNGPGFYNRPTDSLNIYDGAISIRARGQSSRDFSKKSYRFELIDSLGNDTTVSLLGMPKESDWILFAPYTDKSQFRNKFIYDLGARMGNYTPRTRFCELQLNGESEGIYLLTEQIKRDKNRVNISKITETDISGFNVSGGYIFKYDKTDPNSKVRIKQREIVYPDVLQPEQNDYLTRFFTEYDSILLSNNFMDPQNGFRRYACDSSLVDFLIINEIGKNADSYLFSTYLHKDRDDKDGRVKFGPLWDYDLAFGNTIFQNGSQTTGWQFEINTVMRITRYLQDPELVKLFQNRWWELRQTTLSNDAIFGYMNELVHQIEVVRERNYQVWPIIDKNLFYPGYYVDSYENEIDYMHNWLTDRLEWIDNNIDNIYYKLKLTGTETLASDFQFKAYPNPFSETLLFSLYTEKPSEARIEVYNMAGQKQLECTQVNADGFFYIEPESEKLQQMQKGIYIAKLYIDGAPVKTEKMVKK